MKENDNVVVVIATYNEADTIGTILSALSDYVVVVVDDNSPDGTAAIAKSHGAHLILRPKKLGIKSAFFDGFREALTYNRMKYVVQMDAGLTHSPGDVKRLVSIAIDTGSDLVIGSRFIDGIKIKGWRSFISLGGSFLMRRVGLAGVTDSTSGYRCWSRRAIKTMLNTSIKAKGFAFQLETLFYTHHRYHNTRETKIAYLLSNSSFRWRMVWEALKTWRFLLGEYWHFRQSENTRY